MPAILYPLLKIVKNFNTIEYSGGTPDIDELTLDLWLLIHPDLRGVRRVKVVADTLAGFFGNMKNSPGAAGNC